METARAQGTYTAPPFQVQNSNPGIAAGRFILYPAISFNYAHDDNLFYQSDNIPGIQLVATGRYEIVPRILIDLPLSRSRVRFQYAPVYREYTNADVGQVSKWSHFFDFEGSMLIHDVFSVIVRDHYVQGTQEVQEFDPGGEIRFNLIPFTLQEPSLELGLDLGARHRVSFIPRYYELNFDDSFGPVFYDYTRKGYEGRYTYKLSPETQFYAFTTSDYTQQDRADNFYGTVDVDMRSTGVGLQRLTGGIITTGGSVAWEQQNYTGGGGGDYQGVAADINMGWNATDVMHFDLGFRRNAYQSYFVNNNFYINLEGRLRMIRQVGQTAFWQIGLGLQQNDYGDPVDVRMTPAFAPSEDADNDGYVDLFESYLPSQGVVRKDRAAVADVGAGWRLRPTLRFLVGYNYQRRDSNMVQDLGAAGFVESFDYSASRVYFTLEMGIL
ncbi:MAG TPA: hypothetical protein VFQ07_13725 [Candidatus Polarisedimenticolia bacterium]|nr:hypothetical protein [Candidatus Polarisedimenticolia bacterium]